MKALEAIESSISYHERRLKELESQFYYAETDSMRQRVSNEANMCRVIVNVLRGIIQEIVSND